MRVGRPNRGGYLPRSGLRREQRERGRMGMGDGGGGVEWKAR